MRGSREAQLTGRPQGHARSLRPYIGQCRRQTFSCRSLGAPGTALWLRRAKGRCWASSEGLEPPGSSDNTIRSLDNLLGSNDSADEGDQALTSFRDNGEPWERRLLRTRRVPDAAAQRVRPLYVYVIYYCFICVYLSAAWLQATDGDVAASILVDGLVNDHLAVATGQVPRLATAGFVCEGPLELFMQLATLLTVGAELEALLGYSLFWAVYWLGNLSGSLADAALSELPVTYGPANAAAGMVGALVAFYIRNWELEERIAAAREEARDKRKVQVEAALGPKSNRSKPFSASRDSVEDAEAEVELLPFWTVKFKAKLGGNARGALNVLVALVVAGQGLLEFGDASHSASWIGLIAAAWAGAMLTYATGPQYEVTYEPPPMPADSDGGGGSSSGASGSGGGAQQAADGGTAGGRAGRLWGPAPDADGLRVVDVCPPARRQGVLLGGVGALALCISMWLAMMAEGA